MLLLKVPDNTDPKLNLAIEEYAVRNLPEGKEYLFVYVNNPCVIIGKNQNPYQEVNLKFIEKNNVEMLRRISGGGAVYHDQGNINFCYITGNTKENFNRYHNFLQPVINYLHELKIPAEINNRNDIVVDGKKVSGNAQFTSRNRMFSHGTLLFDANLETISRVLNPKYNATIESKSTRSVKTTVTNLVEYLAKPPSIYEFKTGLIESILSHFSGRDVIELSPNEWQEIYRLKTDKYSTRQWNFNRTPGFKLKVENRDVLFKATLEINAGCIEKIITDKSSSFPELAYNYNPVLFQKEEIKKWLRQLNKTNSGKETEELIKTIYPF